MKNSNGIQKKGVGITGPFADVNFGDYAMLLNNLYDLQIKDVVLFSYDDEFLNTIANEYLKKYNISIVDIRLKHGLPELFAENYTITPLELLSSIENYEEIARALKEIKVLIVNGGGYFNELWSMPHRIEKLMKIIAPVLVANQLGKRIFFTGNSFGPFGEDSAFFACLFNVLDNTILCCRDNLFSPMWLKQLGINRSKIKYIPDDMFSINQGLLELDTNIEIKAENYIVLETYLPLEFFKKNVEHFIYFSERMYEKYDLSIVFLPFHLKHGGMDQAMYLNTILDHFEYYDIVSKGYLPIQDATEIIKKAKLVISSRYHALIVALYCGTPVVNALKTVLNDKLYYYNKCFGILRELMKGTAFDERFYLRTDYLEMLTFIAENYNNIIDYQLKQYRNDQYALNRKRLTLLRQKHLNEIWRCI